MRAFKRVHIPAGKTVDVEFDLGDKELVWWNPQSNTMCVSEGSYELMVGGSSQTAGLLRRSFCHSALIHLLTKSKKEKFRLKVSYDPQAEFFVYWGYTIVLLLVTVHEELHVISIVNDSPLALMLSNFDSDYIQCCRI